jgi:hypothetical protein
LGLENLKSVFTEGLEKFRNSDVTKLNSALSSTTSMNMSDLTQLSSQFVSGISVFNQSDVTGIPSQFTEGGVLGSNEFTQTDVSTTNIIVSTFNRPSVELQLDNSIRANFPVNFDNPYGGGNLYEIFPFSDEASPNPAKLYNEYNYDPRTDVINKNPYQGSSKDTINTLWNDNVPSIELQFDAANFGSVIGQEFSLQFDNPGGQGNLYENIPFVVNTGGEIPFYNQIAYDPRTNHIIDSTYGQITPNNYLGTRYDDVDFDPNKGEGIGGIFNSSNNKYSSGFRTINSPKGYFTSETGNDIMTGGNKGLGYTELNKTISVGDTSFSIMDVYLSQRTEWGGSPSSNPNKYIKDGGINIDRTLVSPTIPEFSGLMPIDSSFSTGDVTRTIQVEGSDYIANQLEDLGWDTLYDGLHHAKQAPDGSGFIGYHYGAFVNRDNLNIRGALRGDGNRTGAPREQGRGIRGPEPYIISKIPNGGVSTTIGDSVGGELDGRDLNYGKRSFPAARSVTDVARLGYYLSSEDGIAFSAGQFIAGNRAGFTFYDQATTSTSNVEGGHGSSGFYQGGSIYSSDQRFGQNFTPVASTLAAPLATLIPDPYRINIRRDLGNVTDTLAERTQKFLNADGTTRSDIQVGPYMDYTGFLQKRNFHNGLGSSTYSDGGQTTFTGRDTAGDNFATNFTGLGGLAKGILSPFGVKARLIKQGSTLGDKMTRAAMFPTKQHKLGDYNGGIDSSTTIDRATTQTKGGNEKSLGVQIEHSKNGMPMYFRDMRDGTYVIFRAYLEGLTETITPTWTPINYIGRSEPAYTYERAERQIDFTLKLFAGTYPELQSIAQKMNRLTSMCYPEYKDDGALQGANNRVRMKPPLVKFRLGELYGNENKEVMGFLSSLTYTVPETSPWETDRGRRIPKHILATISYKVIHDKVPGLDFAQIGGVSDGKTTQNAFYGVNQNETFPSFGRETDITVAKNGGSRKYVDYPHIDGNAVGGEISDKYAAGDSHQINLLQET